MDALLTHPVQTGGTLVMAAMTSAILVNALALQPGVHPAPLFQGTRPAAVDTTSTQSLTALTPPARPDDVDDLLARTTGRPSTVDNGLVLEIQTELKRRGYYDGAVDGLPGPMTSAAVIAFQKDHGLPPKGEPTGDVLAELRGAARKSAAEPETPAAVPAVAVPKPRPAPRAAATPAETPRVLPVAVPPEAVPTATPAVATVDPPPAAPEPAAPGSAVLESAATGSIAPDAAASAASADPRLARIQQALDLLGFGPIRPDGLWSEETSAAIRRFEEHRGLTPTGRLNERFLADLVAIGGLSVN